VHRGLARARPRRQPAARRRAHRHLRDDGDHRRRRVLLHPPRGRRGRAALVEAGRVQAGAPAVTAGRTLDDTAVTAIADELAHAETDRTTVPLLTARHPGVTVADASAVQNAWRRRGIGAGRRPVGRKIGLTSKVMQAATGITEPDYGAIFADMVVEDGAVIEHARFSNVRVEVELAFVLRDGLTGPHATVFDVLRATDYVVPALEILDSRIEMEGRTIVDTISDNAAMGAMVVGGRPSNPTPWTSAGSLRSSTRTRQWRKPEWPRGSWTIRRTACTGWPTRSPPTGIPCRPATSSWPDPSPARSGCTKAI